MGKDFVSWKKGDKISLLVKPKSAIAENLVLNYKRKASKDFDADFFQYLFRF